MADKTINSLISTLSHEDHIPRLECNLKKYNKHGVDPSRLSVADYCFDNFPESPLMYLNHTLDKIKFAIFSYEELEFYQSPKTKRHIEAKEFDTRHQKYLSGVDKVKKMLGKADDSMFINFAAKVGINRNKSIEQIRDEVTKYYEGKHFYSVYQNAIWEYLRPLATNSCELDFDDDFDDLDFS